MGAASTSGSLCGRSSKHVRGCAGAERSCSWRAGGTLLPRYGAAHKLLCLQPGAGSLAAFQTTWPRRSFSGAGEGFLPSHGVQGDGSHHPDGNSTQPQPCISQQRVLHEQGPKLPQTAPFCLFPKLQLPRALLPPGFWESARTKPSSTSPTASPSPGWPCPCHRQCLGEHTQIPFCQTHMSWIT